jgi:ATP-dependent Clp protease ATP-binding subunit ClpA
MSENKESMLVQFSTEITKLAKEGLLDPVIGREKEIERIAQILSRRNKNNPVLVGEPGCVDGETIITIQKISDDTTHENVEIDF